MHRENNVHHASSSSSSSIVIQNINLWHAPQSCCTNVHYDEQDNLLLVTEGVKTVELCPPGCIRGSGIHSEHANHPALLRSRGQGDDDVETMMDDGANNNNGKGEQQQQQQQPLEVVAEIRSEIQVTRDLKRQRTHIVSVSAGEGLYIPAGWWHRVESATSSLDNQNGGCTAINVWFDYKHASRADAPKHMVPFQLRRTARKYYELHADHAANLALEKKRREAGRMRVSRHALEEESNSRMCGSRHALKEKPKKRPTLSKDALKLVEGYSLMARGPAYEMRVFGTDLAKCWTQLMLELPFAENGLLEDIIGRFRMQLEYLLLFVDLNDYLHVEELIRMWALFLQPAPSLGRAMGIGSSSSSGTQQQSNLFTKLILGLSSESCFIIIQAWERHASSSAPCGEKSLEVEASYKHFFELAGDGENEKRVRAHLMSSVEDFRCKTCQTHLMEGVLLGKV